MDKNNEFSGFVTLIGEPNAGKSTLINTIFKKKIVITSFKAQTTRNFIRCVFVYKNKFQFIFIDTPGVHKGGSKENELMGKEVNKAIKDVDLIYFLCPCNCKFDERTTNILNFLKKLKNDIFLLITKSDLLKEPELLIFKNKVLSFFKEINFKEVFFISCVNELNTDHLLETSTAYLKNPFFFYEKEQEVLTSSNFQISELIRETIFEHLRCEIPYDSIVLVDLIKKNEEKNMLIIYVSILLKKNSQKIIFIGKNGENIKKIGMISRQKIENLLGQKVYLQLHVKPTKHWISNFLSIN
ncbi:GTPase Era [symbiont of Argiope bruennichi]|uniref:GTPase Era n=1 Tax=symbiont of Argiope bruennichi TaxID=2810479 RepID=UPI003DA2F95C